MSGLDQAPVRVCCGARHWTVQCPDGLVMCCLCFERVAVGALSITEDGRPEDVCKPCRAHERAIMNELGDPQK